MTLKPLVPLLFLSLLLSSCADDNFFQKDALATKEEVAGAAPAGPDSVWVIAGRHYDRSAFFRLFWGNHNRAIWTTPVQVPVFDLNKTKGGLKVLSLGGGFQTTSFELQDSTGRRYAFRSIDKDPVEVLPKFWHHTFVAGIVRDQTSASNPYGALVVPVLAQAVGVPHSNPAIYYVSYNDTTFGEYASRVQGRLFLLEDKFKVPADLNQQFGDAHAFLNSDDALRLRFSSNHYHFDQKAFARARLLDLLIGDWDRHKGQWDWAVSNQGQDTLFKPIPKDRDQVFLKMDDGIVPSIATSKLMARKLHSFDNRFKDVKAYMINAEFIDERLLNELSRDDWQRIARQMQAALTDQVIERAVRQFPRAVYNLIGKDVTQALKNRRDELPEAAKKMYKILAQEVTIAGSDLVEQFLVKRLLEGQVEVTITRPASGAAPEKTLYHRVFNPKETERIILHGLADDDVFTIEGETKESIKIDVYGGLGEDEITDRSSVQGFGKMTRIYDTERGNELDFGTEARDHTTRDVRVHAFDREGN
ncbi:hypothetical protein [Pontibacter ruber]|uniref:Uncharacterized protein n=1 Tax=Pontibacter ruber TaxID=1343895 RepID=A0ABW5CUS6_9BACT|nr:hypothetical protein [Pontibacter ruber]